MPELRLMRSFVAVATHGSITRAAREGHIAQQALSEQIRALEQVVGVALLTRSTRGVELTIAGAVFLDEAKEVLAAADRAVDRAQRAARGEAGQLRVVHTLATAYETVPVLLRAYRNETPGVRVALREVWAEDLPGLLLDGRADVGLCPASPLPEGLHRAPVRREPLVAVLPAGHPLAESRTIQLALLRDETICVWPRAMAPGFYDAVLGACRAAGFEPKVDVDAGGNTIWSTIAEGRGVGLTVASIERQRPEGIAVVHLTGPPPTLTIEVAARSGESPLTGRFLSVARATSSVREWLAP